MKPLIQRGDDIRNVGGTLAVDKSVFACSFNGGMVLYALGDEG